MTIDPKVGDFVKALRDGQRMWFQVMAIDGDKLTTMLDSEPVTQIEWAPGDVRELPNQSTLKRNDTVTLLKSEVMEVLRD